MVYYEELLGLIEETVYFMAKVSDVLKLPIMRGVRVAAGVEGLSRKVEHVTVMEVPEIKRWLKGNDFLITSFYSVRKSEADQCALIRDLADTCCCIAVKTGQYVEKIAESVRQAADEAGLPLLEIPGELPYIDIIVNVMNLIFEEEGNSEILEKYVKDILYENYSDEILMAERGRLFGMDVEHDWFSAVVVNFRKKYVPDEQDWKGIRFLGRTLMERMRAAAGIGECAMILLEKGYLILAEGERKDEIRGALSEIFEEQRIRSLWMAGEDKFVCSVGSVRTGLIGIRETYSDAFKAIRVMRKLHPESCVCVYEQVEAYCVLQDFMMSGKGEVFEKVLRPVESAEFLDTLCMYFACSGNVDETAEVLHTHRNTVKYRLGRVQAVTGLDLRRPEDSFKLYMGVLALRMKER